MLDNHMSNTVHMQADAGMAAGSASAEALKKNMVMIKKSGANKGGVKGEEETDYSSTRE